MNHFLEVAPLDAAGNVAELRPRDRVDRADAEVGPDEVDAERRALDQRLELLAAVTQRALELPALAGERKVRADAGEQLARAERLDEIVIGARTKAFDARFLAGTRRQHDDGHGPCPRVGANRRQQAEAVEPRHHDVREHEVRELLARSRRAPAARHRRRRRRSGARASAERSRACLHCRRRAGLGPRARRQLPRGRGVRDAFAHRPASKRSASSTNGCAPVRVGASSRGAPIRSAGKCCLPFGRRTVNVVPIALAALEPDVAAMELDQLAHEREADAGTFVRPRAHVAYALEALEQLRQIGLGDTDARVADAELDALAARSQGHLDLAVERELESVREKIQDDLLPHVAVDVGRLVERLAIDDELETRAARWPSGIRSRARRSRRRDRSARSSPRRARPRCARSRAAS